jgi:hypothetical protein
MRLTKDDSRDIGFARWCLACQAISKEEFRQWVLYVLSEVENPPAYIYDLVDFDGCMTEIVRIMPFAPDWSPTQREMAAISGIALSRGVSPYESVNVEICKKALSEWSAPEV